MNVEDFEKTMIEEPDHVNEDVIRENLAQMEQTETDTESTPGQNDDQQPDNEQQDVSVSLGALAGMVAGVYCRLSDFVYKKVRKTESAPEWSEDDRAAIEAAIAPVLGKYNVALSPATNLVITIVVIEGMRYTMYKTKEIENGSAEV